MATMRLTERRRLTDVHQTFIVQMWASYRTFHETIDAFMVKFADEIGECDEKEFRDWLWQRINYYRHHPNAAKWRPIMQQYRDEFNAGIEDEILANKRMRLQLLHKDMTENPKADIPRIIAEARKEVEGNTVNVRVEAVHESQIRELTPLQRARLKELLLANPTASPMKMLEAAKDED